MNDDVFGPVAKNGQFTLENGDSFPSSITLYLKNYDDIVQRVGVKNDDESGTHSDDDGKSISMSDDDKSTIGSDDDKNRRGSDDDKGTSDDSALIEVCDC